ncbi:type II secretion system protein [Coraliomargarita sp. SDUM461003]|uniref:Type II secretion system protein n=1 Tax=Thalassobacterium maritimum TaxID=3041265 RepID=A0ABU1AXC6_9BACT|nr:type II secretion system protein [Coraliomargarita sp. SDUM461003]MDQ8207909.1 type II secretion system protein [Coraliomargarita sp. SDUM461003]
MKKLPKAAFTLIELLTVIAVIAVLAAILIPAVGAARHRANSSKSVSNLRQIGNAVSLFTNQHKGIFPLLNRKLSDPDSTSQYFWVQALEEEILEWDRSESGKHPMFDDPTAQKSHGISDYGGSTYIFLDANPDNTDRSTSGFSVNRLENPAQTLVLCTAYAENTGNASWYIQGDFAKGSNPTNIPEPRLNNGEVGVVFADGHTELLSREKVYDLEFRKRLFDPSEY